ncbi:hypothetical protein B0T13DRAFT_459253 [Neurospora crassa]|nr:hypothetical protein B0T13DRAFT_459253 [Neurospora crassa]
MPITTTTATILGLPTSHLPLLLHLLIETPASLSFLLRPESQLPLLSSPSSSSPSPSSPSLSPSPSSTSPSSSTTTSSSSSSTALSSPRSSAIITTQQATEARLILRNFGGLLLSVNCLVFYLLFRHRFSSTSLRPENERDDLIRGVTACLSLYHVFPLYRAWKRICMSSSSRAAVDENIKKRKKDLRGEEGKEDETQKTLGGPVVHFVVHMIVGGLMGAAGLGLL